MPQSTHTSADTINAIFLGRAWSLSLSAPGFGATWYSIPKQPEVVLTSIGVWPDRPRFFFLTMSPTLIKVSLGQVVRTRPCWWYTYHSTKHAGCRVPDALVAH